LNGPAMEDTPAVASIGSYVVVSRFSLRRLRKKHKAPMATPMARKKAPTLAPMIAPTGTPRCTTIGGDVAVAVDDDKVEEVLEWSPPET
jgi:hypothetical protein